VERSKKGVNQMQDLKKKEEIASKIVRLFSENNLTIQEAIDILKVSEYQLKNIVIQV
jgi:hypothetical protein